MIYIYFWFILYFGSNEKSDTSAKFAPSQLYLQITVIILHIHDIKISELLFQNGLLIICFESYIYTESISK